MKCPEVDGVREHCTSNMSHGSFPRIAWTFIITFRTIFFQWPHIYLGVNNTHGWHEIFSTSACILSQHSTILGPLYNAWVNRFLVTDLSLHLIISNLSIITSYVKVTINRIYNKNSDTQKKNKNRYFCESRLIIVYSTMQCMRAGWLNLPFIIMRIWGPKQ